MATLLNYRLLQEGENVDELIAASYTCPTDGFVYAWQDQTRPQVLWHFTACPIDDLVAQIKTRIAAYVTTAYNNSAQVANPLTRVRGIVKWVHEQIAAWIADPQNVDPLYEGHLSLAGRLVGWIIDEMVTQGILATP